MSKSVWSKEVPPSAILPPAPIDVPPAGRPDALGLTESPVGPRRWRRAGSALNLVLVVGVSAAVASAITYAATRTDRVAAPASPQTVSPSPAPVAPQFSPAEEVATKQNLCHVFDTSVGHEGHGGFRVQGNLNVPVTLQAVTSAMAVQNALVPAVPADVASAARKYINTTLGVATAAMGDTSISEINRLTTISNDAVNALLDVCGLSR